MNLGALHQHPFNGPLSGTTQVKGNTFKRLLKTYSFSHTLCVRRHSCIADADSTVSRRSLGAHQLDNGRRQIRAGPQLHASETTHAAETTQLLRIRQRRWLSAVDAEKFHCNGVSRDVTKASGYKNGFETVIDDLIDELPVEKRHLSKLIFIGRT